MAARSARSWNFFKYFGLFQWEKIIFCQNAYFCLKMIFRPCYFYFFSILGEWGGWVLESMENSILFFLKPSLLVNLSVPKKNISHNDDRTPLPLLLVYRRSILSSLRCNRIAEHKLFDHDNKLLFLYLCDIDHRDLWRFPEVFYLRVTSIDPMKKREN